MNDSKKVFFGWRGWLFEAALWAITRPSAYRRLHADEVRSIFVLRNNDLGDLIVTTPLFQALRERFPNARISVGVGDWAREILKNNPYVTDLIPLNAPWANKFIGNQTHLAGLKYIFQSAEAKYVAEQKYDVGIDIFGYGYGSLLLWRCGIGYRIGVRGPHGGWSGTHWAYMFDRHMHVSLANLRVAQHFGNSVLPRPRPQLFLTAAELAEGEVLWPRRQADGQRRTRVALGPGAGLPEKCWPLESFSALAQILRKNLNVDLVILGGNKDRDAAEYIQREALGAVSLAGKLSLRQTFAVIAASDLVICNGSMLAHAAAAFDRNVIVLLSEHFPSAGDYEKLWGYPELGPTLGGSGNSLAIDAVYNAVERLLVR